MSTSCCLCLRRAGAASCTTGLHTQSEGGLRQRSTSGCSNLSYDSFCHRGLHRLFCCFLLCLSPSVPKLLKVSCLLMLSCCLGAFLIHLPGAMTWDARQPPGPQRACYHAGALSAWSPKTEPLLRGFLRNMTSGPVLTTSFSVASSALPTFQVRQIPPSVLETRPPQYSLNATLPLSCTPLTRQQHDHSASTLQAGLRASAYRFISSSSSRNLASWLVQLDCFSGMLLLRGKKSTL